MRSWLTACRLLGIFLAVTWSHVTNAAQVSYSYSGDDFDAFYSPIGNTRASYPQFAAVDFQFTSHAINSISAAEMLDWSVKFGPIDVINEHNGGLYFADVTTDTLGNVLGYEIQFFGNSTSTGLFVQGALTGGNSVSQFYVGVGPDLIPVGSILLPYTSVHSADQLGSRGRGVWTHSSPIPIPRTIWLVGSSISCLAMFRRRQDDARQKI